MKELNEVSPRRLAEYKAIRAKVDAKAKHRTLEEIGTLGFGLCQWFWKHKKQILRDEYHMNLAFPERPES